MLRKYGIPVREEYIVDGHSYDIESGSNAMYRFIREDHPMPSAIIAINDFTAVGIVRALREQLSLIHIYVYKRQKQRGAGFCISFSCGYL